MAYTDIESGKGELPRRKERANTCGCGRILYWILCFIFFILLLLASLIVALYFVLKPKAPQVTLERIDVQSMSLDAGNISLTNQTLGLDSLGPLTRSSLYFNSNTTLYIRLNNPNKVDLNFKSINISAYYRNESIGNSLIPTFTQTKESSMNITSQFISQNVPLVTSGLSFLNDFMNDSIPFNLLIASNANIQIWGVATPSAKVEVSCKLEYSPVHSRVTSKVCSIQHVKVG